MNLRRYPFLENPSPGTIALLFILSLTVFVLADGSARAGRAEAWVMLCGECRTVDPGERFLHVRHGALNDVALNSHQIAAN